MEGRCFIKGRWGADSPVESEGGHKGGGAYFRGLSLGGGCVLECGSLFENYVKHKD